MARASDIERSAKYIHAQLKGYYQAWEELEVLANEMGQTLDTKTAKLKPMNNNL
ncbi:hypothetical protein [Maribacter sp. Hel_I_7]|uniref:hypothetical protein n=1 Tax=Maribacter sp. Hel_I_7 TaxID=1249997 RepID=UPI000AB107CC|nr:hypothetical protein [Maribacter sp. Hel_I_7]